MCGLHNTFHWLHTATSKPSSVKSAAAAAKSLQSCPTLCDPKGEHWSGLPFPSPIHESEKWKWSRSVMSDPQWPHGLQPTRLLHPWDFPGKSTGVGCHCLLHLSRVIISNLQISIHSLFTDHTVTFRSQAVWMWMLASTSFLVQETNPDSAKRLREEGEYLQFKTFPKAKSLALADYSQWSQSPSKYNLKLKDSPDTQTTQMGS